MNDVQRIEVIETNDGKWKWQYYGPRGTFICESRWYTSKAGAINGLLIARAGIKTAKAIHATEEHQPNSHKKKTTPSQTAEKPTEMIEVTE